MGAGSLKLFIGPTTLLRLCVVHSDRSVLRFKGGALKMLKFLSKGRDAREITGQAQTTVHILAVDLWGRWQEAISKKR